MKKLLSVLLLVVLVISLATTALADTVVDAETDAMYKDAVMATLPSYESHYGVTITKPTENFFVMKAPLSDKTVLTIETDSETPIKGWHCYLYNYLNNLVAAPFLAVNYDDSEWVINSISKDFGYIKKVGDNNTNSIKGETWVGFSLLSEIKEDVEIRIKVYKLEHSSSQFDPDDPTTYGELKAQTTYTFKAKAEDPSSAFKLETSESEIICGETVNVEVKANSANANDQLKFTYNTDKFESIYVPDGWTANTDGSYSYTCAAAITSETSLGTFQFKAKMLADAAYAVFTVGKTSDTTPVQAKVTIGLNTIQYEVHDVSAVFGGTQQVKKTYNGQEQQVEITVTEPADVTFEFSDDNGGISDGNWYDNAPTLKDAGNIVYHVKISALGYRDADIRIQFVIEKAIVTITPKDVTLNVGESLPTTFEYEVTGLVGGDKLKTEPTITCLATNTNTPGTYTLTASGAEVSDNYMIKYVRGTLTVNDVWIVKLDDTEYKVVKGEDFTFPKAPTKPGCIFLGWRGADGATYQPGEEVAISGDTSFKAVWANMPDVTPGGGDEPDVDVFPFYDVSVNAWYYDAVKYVWDNGLMNGTGTAEFSPNTTLNRAMVWTILARLDGVDVDGGATWYSKAQEWAMAEGVSDGTDPMGAVTREQLVTMLWRFKGEPAVDFLLTSPDADTISDWAREAMRWAVSNGIIEGDENGCITPTATATRAQAAAIFMRFVEQ